MKKWYDPSVSELVLSDTSSHNETHDGCMMIFDGSMKYQDVLDGNIYTQHEKDIIRYWSQTRAVFDCDLLS